MPIRHRIPRRYGRTARGRYHEVATSAAGGAKPAETAPEGPLRTESGAILTNGAEPATGTPIDSLQMLETVIGCALYPSDFDISNPPGAIIRAVTEMKNATMRR